MLDSDMDFFRTSSFICCGYPREKFSSHEVIRWREVPNGQIAIEAVGMFFNDLKGLLDRWPGYVHFIYSENQQVPDLTI